MFVFRSRRSSFLKRAYTLVELFLTIAVLMIVLQLMVSLSNRVRRESADRLTRQMLRDLAVRMDDYIAANGGAVPEITPLIDTGPIDESTLQKVARQNNAQFLKCLNLPPAGAGRTTEPDDLARNVHRDGAGQPALDDPWGTPIVFMPRQDPAIGMAPNNRAFFFSAGPDTLFLTREDNLYSYEEETSEK